MPCVYLTWMCKRPRRSYQQDLQANRPLLGDDAEMPDTSIAEPEADEGSDWESIEVEYDEWTDEELMDDARPGRRLFAGNQDVRPFDIAQEAGKANEAKVQIGNEEMKRSEEKKEDKSTKDRNTSLKLWIFDDDDDGCKIRRKHAVTLTTPGKDN